MENSVQKKTRGQTELRPARAFYATSRGSAHRRQRTRAGRTRHREILAHVALDVGLPRTPHLDALDQDRELERAALDERARGRDLLTAEGRRALIERELRHERRRRDRRNRQTRVQRVRRHGGDRAALALGDREVTQHLRVVVLILKVEGHPDRESLLDQHRARKLPEGLAASRPTLIADAAVGGRREIEVTRRVEHADVAGEAGRARDGRRRDGADAPRVDRNEHARARAAARRTREVAVAGVRDARVLRDVDFARARRTRLGVGAEVADVGRELVDEEDALVHAPVELVRVGEVPGRVPVVVTPLEDAGEQLRARRDLRGGEDRLHVVRREDVGADRRRVRRTGGGGEHVADLHERHRLAEDVEAEPVGDHVRLQDAVDDEARVHRVDTGHRLGVLEHVDLVAERLGEVGVEDRDVGRPRHVLDDGHVREAALKDPVGEIIRRGLAKPDELGTRSRFGRGRH